MEVCDDPLAFGPPCDPPLTPLALAPAARIPPAARKPVLFHPVTEARWVYRLYGVEDKVGREVVMSVKEKVLASFEPDR